jgi:hypothetical protein
MTFSGAWQHRPRRRCQASSMRRRCRWVVRHFLDWLEAGCRSWPANGRPRGLPRRRGGGFAVQGGLRGGRPRPQICAAGGTFGNVPWPAVPHACRSVPTSRLSGARMRWRLPQAPIGLLDERQPTGLTTLVTAPPTSLSPTGGIIPPTQTAVAQSRPRDSRPRRAGRTPTTRPAPRAHRPHPAPGAAPRRWWPASSPRRSSTPSV